MPDYSQIHLRAGSGGGEKEKWFALQDLEVREVRADMVFLGDTVIQVCFCGILHPVILSFFAFLFGSGMGEKGYAAKTDIEGR